MRKNVRRASINANLKRIKLKTNNEICMFRRRSEQTNKKAASELRTHGERQTNNKNCAHYCIVRGVNEGKKRRKKTQCGYYVRQRCGKSLFNPILCRFFRHNQRVSL